MGKGQSKGVLCYHLETSNSKTLLQGLYNGYIGLIIDNLELKLFKVVHSDGQSIAVLFPMIHTDILLTRYDCAMQHSNMLHLVVTGEKCIYHGLT